MTMRLAQLSTLGPLLVFTSGLAGTGCKTKEEKPPVVNAERQVDEAAKKLGEAAAQLGASAAHLGVQGAAAGIEGASAGMAAAAAEMKNAAGVMNAASGQAGSAKVPLVDFRALKALLPESISDLPRKNVGGEKSGAMGFGISQASGVYVGAGGTRIDVKLIDAGAMGAMFGAMGLSGLEIDKENDDGYERTTTLSGRKALEKYNSKTKHGEIKIFVGGRYVVEVDGQDVGPDTLKKAVAALDLAKLESLK